MGYSEASLKRDHEQSRAALAAANQALRTANYEQALRAYFGLVQDGVLDPTIVATNVMLARNRWQRERAAAGGPVLLAGEPSARLQLLARLYQASGPVTVLLTEPVSPATRAAFSADGLIIQVLDSDAARQSLPAMLELALQHPCVTLHLVGHTPLLLLGACLRLLWATRVLYDAAVNALDADALRTTLACVDSYTVATPSSQASLGGVLVEDAWDTARLSLLARAPAIPLQRVLVLTEGVDSTHLQHVCNKWPDSAMLTLVLDQYGNDHPGLRYLGQAPGLDTLADAGDALLLLPGASNALTAAYLAQGRPVLTLDPHSHMHLVEAGLLQAIQAEQLATHLHAMCVDGIAHEWGDATAARLALQQSQISTTAGNWYAAWQDAANAANPTPLLQLANLLQPPPPVNQGPHPELARLTGLLMQYGISSRDACSGATRLYQADREAFLNQTFEIALGRSPQEHEFEHFDHLLEKGAERIPLLLNLLKSPEACTLRANQRKARAMQPSLRSRTARQVAADTIELPTSETPLVSVIIPIYGKIDYTLMCLASIAEQAPQLPFEVLVVDDCSPDHSLAELAKVGGIRVIRNATNGGFIRSCNHGASQARGSFLCFLNNDTEVGPQWLEHLVQTFVDFPGVGLVGSKFVYPDGRLQEAGGIVWRDGSAWNFGRLQDPDLPHFNYAREVDYCSGASILLRADLFNELGGFDEYYLPAYCEDCDLALKVRARGLRVIYQPASVVIHYEGITSGTDTGSGAKAYQVINTAKMFARWQEMLSSYQPNGEQVDRAKDRGARYRVLVLDHCTPTPDQDAGSVNAFNLLLLLREMGYQVTFIAEDNFLYMPGYTSALQRQGIEVLYAPHVCTLEEHLESAQDRYDLALLFRPGVVERRLSTVRRLCPSAKVLFHTVDLHFLRMQREAELSGDADAMAAAMRMKQLEYAAIEAVDATIVVSTTELELLRPDFPNAALFVVPLFWHIRSSEVAFAERDGIVFVGGYQHMPNIDAVEFFVADVMPLLRQVLPGVTFYIVGSNPTERVTVLAANDVQISGFIEDLPAFLDQRRLNVAPLRYGAGIKGKIGTAMANGLPTVATSLAAEGMSLSNGHDIVIADSAAELATALAALYQDEARWAAVQQDALRSADRLWGLQAAWRIFGDVLRNLGMQVPSDAPALQLYH